MDPWVGNQVVLEIRQIGIRGTIKLEWSGDGGHDLRNQMVEFGVGWSLNVQVTTTDVVDSLLLVMKA